jgi:hypothetical protein
MSVFTSLDLYRSFYLAYARCLGMASWETVENFSLFRITLYPQCLHTFLRGPLRSSQTYIPTDVHFYGMREEGVCIMGWAVALQAHWGRLFRLHLSAFEGA